PVEVIHRPMDRVPARFGNDVYRAARAASPLRARLRLRREFFNRVNRQDDAGNTRDSALIDRGNVVPEIVVIHAVDLPIDLVRARSIDRTEPANVIATKAWLDGDQLGEVPAVQRQFLHLV